MKEIKKNLSLLSTKVVILHTKIVANLYKNNLAFIIRLANFSFICDWKDVLTSWAIFINFLLAAITLLVLYLKLFENKRRSLSQTDT